MLDTDNCIGNGRTEGLFHHCNRMCELRRLHTIPCDPGNTGTAGPILIGEAHRVP